ncbi:exosortase A [uncultured Thiohalocapsa sp.]|uniref:exosortase A n=1 Tax=uncultured Thiohalocapsa sp. TaxID=768990 RepID=UPI0025D0907F|nr:exosortase A [uncultured Thiohalocapsa sp.]
MTDMTKQTSVLGTAGAATTRGWLDTWGLGLLLLLAAVALVTLAFHQTAWSIVSIWERSETYAHGYLIVPISLWLVWEKRAGLKQLAPEPTALPLLLFLPLGFGWLLGYLVDTLVVQQYAYVGLLVASIWAVLGHRLARYLAFPVLFLFFAVPVGEGLVYPMMNFTADFTVGMLKLTGIPVYREGTFFTIPSGQWSVVEACSGMRYLIASVTLGVLFAYLTYTRWWKRALFVLFSIVVPIIANGFRAYMIVMIGHLSDMKLAVGVDHLIYGWVFFGIIITIMFLVGSIWRDPAAPLPQPAPGRVQPIDRRRALRLLSVMAVAALFWPAAAWALSDHGGKVAPVEVQAPRAPGWTLMPGADLWDWRPRVVGTDGSLYAFYEAAGEADARPVGLYLGIYRTQRQGAELVTSANMMIEQEHPVWSDTMVRPRRVELASGAIGLEQHLLSSRRGERLLIWTWYLVGDSHTANPYLAKLLEAKSRLLGNRGEAALVAVAAPYDEKPEEAAAVLTAFLDNVLPAIDAEVSRSLGTTP